MRIQPFLTSIGVVLALGACVTPSTPLPSTSADSASSGTSAAAPCELSESTPEPLSTPENTPIFEQFNFRPHEIAVTDNTVTLTTAHHIFSLCQTNNEWSIASAEASEDEAPYDYDQVLADIAAPDYETLDVDGQTYEYRIRLQAEWLTEQLKPETTNPEAPEPETTEALEVATEDAVFFELKTPDGELISQQLYTVSELREAQLGASLGVPEIADAISVDSDLWFAASASQGEGDSGFASLIRYSPQTGELTVERPEEIQGDQMTSLAATGAGTEMTLWFGTQRSGEGVPYFPTHGLVAYKPEDQTIVTHTVTSSPLIGAIPYELAVLEDSLWVGTGEGTCQVQWQTVEEADSWRCWRFTAIATLPSDGVEVFDSLLAGEPAAALNQDSVEVLWVGAPEQTASEPDPSESESSEPAATTDLRYEVVYEPGFETQLSQGGYRVTNEVARRAAGGNEIFWPGRQWHWSGERFERTLDEVALNLVGGGPRGLASADSRQGFNFDSHAIRGEFDLLALTDDYTKVRYYSGWIEGADIAVYPTVVPVEAPQDAKPNPLTEMAADLTATQGP